jgi:ubiquinone/menaquinone biosynthesis C-methylase UbiE
LEKGFVNISVLDISAKALEKAKERLGAQAENIDWIVTNITEFEPKQPMISGMTERLFIF